MDAPTSDLDSLATELASAKLAEHAATERRIAIERRIIEVVGLKEEGSTSTTTDQFKVTTTAKLYRKMDWDYYESIKEQIPENLRPVKYKPTLDEKGIKWLETNDPEVYALLARGMTTTPGKPAVAVKAKG